jgi:DNA-binding CsgD family transcriptional regulator
VFTDQLFTDSQWRVLRVALGLTPRQLAVARLLCADCGQKQMAKRLGLSQHTVGTHLRALYERLGVRSRVAVIVRLVLADRAIQAAGSRLVGDGHHPAAVGPVPPAHRPASTGKRKRRAPV